MPDASEPPEPPSESAAVLDATAARLHEEQEGTRARIAGMTRDLEALFDASVDSNADDEHDPEGQTIAFERSQLVTLIEAARAHLAELDAAEQRLQEGTYGRCEV